MKRDQKGFSSIEILIVIVVVGVVGIAAWFVFDRQNSTNSKNADQAKSSEVNTSIETNSIATTPQPEDVIGKIKADYAARYKLLDIDENNKPRQGEMSIRLSKGAPVYKVEGYDYYTDSSSGSSIDLMVGPVDWANDTIPRQADRAVRTEVASTLTAFGLTKTMTYGSKDNGTETYIYTGKGLACSIQAPDAPTSLTGASCARLDTYKEAAARIEPIARAIPNVGKSAVLAGLKITESQVSGYQKAEVNHGAIEGGGGASALLYRKNEGTWIYFKHAQEPPQCSAYDTLDLRNAFKGDPCYDNNDPSTVL